MRTLSRTAIVVAIAIAGASCSRKPESPVRTATTTPGVYVDAQYDENILIEDKLGRRLG